MDESQMPEKHVKKYKSPYSQGNVNQNDFVIPT